MPHVLAQSVEVLTTLLTVAGMGYFVAAMIAARSFLVARRAPLAAFAPGVSVLKSLKGLDPGMIDAFRSHCRQTYAGDYELLFGVSPLNDPAAAAVEQLQAEFPGHAIRLIVGLVTALYRGRAHGTLPSRFEALGIATDFQAGVLLSMMIEGGLHYGLGSTLAVSREALAKIGGFAPLKDHLADDYELGARVAQAGYRIVLSPEVVETAIPAYGWRGFADHQLRWSRTVRDARPWGYAGLIFTHGLGWAVLNVLASGLSPLSLWLLGLSFFLRLSLAMTIGAEVLGDRQVLPSLWLLPLRDLVAMGIWAAGFAGNTIVWRGQRFMLKGGKLHPAE
jgi:ceramide glucosyltransferase